MALINCPECKQSVSDQAATCPHCGYIINSSSDPVVQLIKERNQKNQQLAIGAVIYAVILIAIVLIVYGATHPH
jgi:hypothetical protein